MLSDEDCIENANTNNNYSNFVGTYYIHIFLENISI